VDADGPLEPDCFERRDIVVIDNVSFHKVLAVDDAIRLEAYVSWASGARAHYVRQYSPDLLCGLPPI